MGFDTDPKSEAEGNDFDEGANVEHTAIDTELMSRLQAAQSPEPGDTEPNAPLPHSPSEDLEQSTIPRRSQGATQRLDRSEVPPEELESLQEPAAPADEPLRHEPSTSIFGAGELAQTDGIGRASESGVDLQEQRSAHPPESSVLEPAPQDAIAPETEEDPWAFYEDSASGWDADFTTNRRRLPPGNTLGDESSAQRSQSLISAERSQAASLVAISGLEPGLTMQLQSGQNTLGRGSGNSLVVVHGSVSRAHARIDIRDDAYSITDLGSGNGTFVNGERVAEAQLQDGDELRLGDVTFRVEMLQSRASQSVSEQPARVKHRVSDRMSVSQRATEAIRELRRQFRARPQVRAAMVSLLVFGVFCMGAVLLWNHRVGKGPKGASEVAFDFFLQGRDAFKRRDWQLAEEHLSVALRLSPRHARSKEYLEEIARERVFDQTLAEAREHYNRGELLSANTKASAVQNSVYSSDAAELLKAIDAELDARVARAKTSWRAGRGDEAKALLVAVDAIRPGRPDVAALLDQLETGAAAHKDSGGMGKRSIAGGRAAVSSGLSRRSLEKLQRGELEAAIQLLRDEGDGSAEQQMLRERMEHLQRVFGNATEAYKAKRSGPAIEKLQEAKQLEAKLTGGRTALAQKIAKMLADMFHVAGIAAMLKDDLPKAYQSFRRAMEHDPGHAAAKRSMQSLADRADEIFDAVANDDGEYAKNQLELILRITSPGHAAHKKALERRSRLR